MEKSSKMDSQDNELFPSLSLDTGSGDENLNMSSHMLSLLSYLGCDLTSETTRSSQANMFPSSLTNLHARATANLICQTQEAIMQEYNITDMDVVHDDVSLDTINEIFSNDDYTLADMSLLSGLNSSGEHDVVPEDSSGCQKKTEDKLDENRQHKDDLNYTDHNNGYNRSKVSDNTKSNSKFISLTEEQSNVGLITQQYNENLKTSQCSNTVSMNEHKHCMVNDSRSSLGNQIYPDFADKVFTPSLNPSINTMDVELANGYHVEYNQKDNKEYNMEYSQKHDTEYSVEYSQKDNQDYHVESTNSQKDKTGYNLKYSQNVNVNTVVYTCSQEDDKEFNVDYSKTVNKEDSVEYSQKDDKEYNVECSQKEDKEYQNLKSTGTLLDKSATDLPKCTGFDKKLNGDTTRSDLTLIRHGDVTVGSTNNNVLFENMFTCPHAECQRKFKYTSHFKYHLQTHIGTRQYKCDCGKTFYTPQQLEVHRRTHTGVRPFPCPQCGKTFATAGNLKNHSRLHSGERPYHCDECNKSFTEVSSLKKHKLTHTGEKPFKCQICGKGFTQSSSRSYHMKRHKDVAGGTTPS